MMFRLHFPVSILNLLPLVFLAGCGQNANETVERLESFEPYAPTEFLQQIYQLDVNHAISFFEQNQDTLVIDVRGTEAFNLGRLPNALCYDSTFEGFPDEMGAIDRKQPVFIYGSNTPEGGTQTSLAVGVIKELRFETIYFLDYGVGIEGWKEAGQTVESGF